MYNRNKQFTDREIVILLVDIAKHIDWCMENNHYYLNRYQAEFTELELELTNNRGYSREGISKLLEDYGEEFGYNE
jgi:hypothetical protein